MDLTVGCRQVRKKQESHDVCIIIKLINDLISLTADLAIYWTGPYAIHVYSKKIGHSINYWTKGLKIYYTIIIKTTIFHTYLWYKNL